MSLLTTTKNPTVSSLTSIFFSMMEFFDFSKIDIEREELNPFQLSEDEMGQ